MSDKVLLAFNARAPEDNPDAIGDFRHTDLVVIMDPEALLRGQVVSSLYSLGEEWFDGIKMAEYWEGNDTILIGDSDIGNKWGIDGAFVGRNYGNVRTVSYHLIDPSGKEEADYYVALGKVRITYQSSNFYGKEATIPLLVAKPHAVKRVNNGLETYLRVMIGGEEVKFKERNGKWYNKDHGYLYGVKLDR